MAYKRREKYDYQRKAQNENFRNVTVSKREMAESMAKDLMTGGRDNVLCGSLSLMHNSYDIRSWSLLGLTDRIERWLIGELTKEKCEEIIKNAKINR